MEYTNSALICYTKLSKNYNKRSDAPKYGYTECIKNIAIHHMAGALSLETCGQVFQNGSGSSNYGIDCSGKKAMYVEEKNRAWTTSTRRDFESITIEVANTPEGVKNKTWEVSDAAIQGLIELCVDICQRNGIKALIWSDSKEVRKSGANGCNMYIHCDYDNTTCPGPYLKSKLPYVAQQVTAILSGSPAPAPTPIEVPNPVLKQGDKGPEVVKLQKALIKAGCSLPKYGADGDYGNETANAVSAFQKKVFETGTYDEKTYNALKAYLNV